jgi:hypothetical protein
MIRLVATGPLDVRTVTESLGSDAVLGHELRSA